jgi:hypothetical protein
LSTSEKLAMAFSDGALFPWADISVGTKGSVSKELSRQHRAMTEDLHSHTIIEPFRIHSVEEQ